MLSGQWSISVILTVSNQFTMHTLVALFIITYTYFNHSTLNVNVAIL